MWDRSSERQSERQCIPVVDVMGVVLHPVGLRLQTLMTLRLNSGNSFGIAKGFGILLWHLLCTDPPSKRKVKVGCGRWGEEVGECVCFRACKISLLELSANLTFINIPMDRLCSERWHCVRNIHFLTDPSTWQDPRSHLSLRGNIFNSWNFLLSLKKRSTKNLPTEMSSSAILPTSSFSHLEICFGVWCVIITSELLHIMSWGYVKGKKFIEFKCWD